MRIRFLLFFIFTAFVLTLRAQDYKVIGKIESLPTDMTARDHIKTDENGRQCAVLRIATQNITPEQREGFHFASDWGSHVVQKSIDGGEILVWVSPGLKTLTIKHSKLGRVDLQTASSNITIESLHTYKVVLQGTLVQPDNTIAKQFLIFDVDPKGAMVIVEGEPWAVSNGVAQKYVDFGTYKYRIEAKDYHPISDRVDVFDTDNKVTVKKTLTPAFGYLKIEGDNAILSKASIYIDNANGNEALHSPQRLGSGQHTLVILHPMYKKYEETVTIKDGETNTMMVNLNANYANVTLKVDADAEIWVNGEKKGVRSWTGNLEAGSYVFECRMKDHKTTRVEQDITSEMSGETLTLEKPEPLTGMLVLSTTPAMASIIIDGENKGDTPMRFNKIPVGKHTLRIEKHGYKPLSKEFVIEEGKTLELEEQLEATAVEKPKKEPKPKAEKPDTPEAKSTWFVTANAAYSFAPQASFGFSVGQVKRFGWFLSAMSNFGFKAMQYDYTADAEGFVDGEYPYYIGEPCKTRISVIGGAMMKVAGPLYLRAGVGYGMRTVSRSADNGQLVRMSSDSWTGVDVSFGAQVHLKGFVMSLEAVTTNFKTVEGKIGVGVCF